LVTPSTDGGQRVAGLRFGAPRTMRVLEALGCAGLTFKAFSHTDLRAVLVERLGGATADVTPARLAYELRKLRGKGLLRKVPRRNLYTLTDVGYRSVVYLTKLHKRPRWTVSTWRCVSAWRALPIASIAPSWSSTQDSITWRKSSASRRRREHGENLERASEDPVKITKFFSVQTRSISLAGTGQERRTRPGSHPGSAPTPASRTGTTAWSRT